MKTLIQIENISWVNMHKAVKKYEDIGSLKEFRSRGINQQMLNDLNTRKMSSVDHMQYACAYDILTS